ncbi:MAG: ATP-binding cassette domain-containing protein [Collinsella aerofaciens]
MARLEIQGISQGFGEVDVLRDVTLDVESGEIACLLGPSGCGKTTLFHVISGLASPRAGRVLLDGENITGRPGRLSLMVQKDLSQHKRIIDNVSLPLVLRGVPVEEARSRAAEPLGSSV